MLHAECPRAGQTVGEQGERGDLQLTNWVFVVEANEKFNGFFMTFKAEEALRVVEPYNGEVF